MCCYNVSVPVVKSDRESCWLPEQLLIGTLNLKEGYERRTNNGGKANSMKSPYLTLPLCQCQKRLQCHNDSVHIGYSKVSVRFNQPTCLPLPLHKWVYFGGGSHLIIIYTYCKIAL